MNINNHIIKSAINGDSKSQRLIYDSCAISLFKLCRLYASTRVEAEDFLQEGFITIFNNLDKYNAQKGSFHTWSRKVMTNTCLQHLRKSQIKTIEYNLNEAVHSVEYIYQNSEFDQLTFEQVLSMLKKLPEGYRVVFNLHVIEGYTHQEVADILNITVSTSKSQLFKAKNTLRNLLTYNKPSLKIYAEASHG